MSRGYSDLRRRVAAAAPAITLVIKTPALEFAPFKATLELVGEIAGDAPELIAEPQVIPEAQGVEIVLIGSQGAGPVRFLGTPSGFELEGLVYALECLAKPQAADCPSLDLGLLQDLSEPVAADLYVAPT